MRPIRALVALLLFSSLCFAVTIAEKTAGMEKATGYFNYYWDAKAGKLWLEIDRWDTEFLYVDSLPAGLGSNDLGLDRGKLGTGWIVKFTRIGPKVLVDATGFFQRDAHDVVATMKHAGPNGGTFKLDPSRSAFFLPRTRNFPKN